MRPTRLFVPFAPVALFATAVACNISVPDDPGGRIFPAAGVIQGTVLYQGPHPCSSNGHIIGNAILLVFDRRNPPPPNGLAVTAVNFADVTGDTLFANEPRYTGSNVYCPAQNGFTDTITVSAPFAIAPLAGASYEIESFFDYTGDFLPTFKIRNLPEMGDIGGGVIDTADALKPINQGNANYQAHFLPVDVGTPEALAAGETIPTFDIPSSGYVTNNITVSIGQPLGLTRPYLYAQGMSITQDPNDGSLTTAVVQSSDSPAPGPDGISNTLDTNAEYQPVLTIPQDIGALGAPSTALSPSAVTAANQFESVLPHLNLVFGVSNGSQTGAQKGSDPNEWKNATDPTQPFHFQVGSGASAQGGFSVWQNAYFDPNLQQWLPLTIPEGVVPMLWPEVILSKLIDDQPDPNNPGQPDPIHGNDPASLTAQGGPGQPVVIMQGITFLNSPQPNPLGGTLQPDTLINTVLGQGTDAVFGNPGYNGVLFNPASGQPTVFTQDHITVGLRPVVICFNHLFDDPPAADTRGTLVTPQSGGLQAGAAAGSPNVSIIPTDLLTNANQIQTNSSGQPTGLTGLQTRSQVTNLVNQVQYGCLPPGRYAINVVYPDGQAWTVPNEAGACSGTEGINDYSGVADGTSTTPTCTLKPRNVLQSQGPRAVVEIVKTQNSANCAQTGPGPTTQIAAGNPGPPFAVPTACLPTQ